MNAALATTWVYSCTPAPASLEVPEHVLLFNTGGPSSRRISQPLQSSLLGSRRGRVQLPSERVLGFQFVEGTDPLEVVEALLCEFGFRDALAADAALLPSLPPCICAPTEVLEASPIATPTVRLRAVPFRSGPSKGSHVRGTLGKDRLPVPAERILVDALLLGHCTATHFNPARPILWTRTSLKRHLRLYRSEGFYV